MIFEDMDKRGEKLEPGSKGTTHAFTSLCPLRSLVVF
jgi:hypothetical protein